MLRIEVFSKKNQPSKNAASQINIDHANLGLVESAPAGVGEAVMSTTLCEKAPLSLEGERERREPPSEPLNKSAFDVTYSYGRTVW